MAATLETIPAVSLRSPRGEFRNTAHLDFKSEENAREMREACQCDIEPVSRPELAAEKKDIIITATSSREPILHGDCWGRRTLELTRSRKPERGTSGG